MNRAGIDRRGVVNDGGSPCGDSHERRRAKRLEHTRFSGVLVAALMVLSACSLSEDASDEPASNEQKMSRADLGDDWPLTVESGIVRCEGAGEIYFDAANGTTYAVNGLALGRDTAPKIDPIWANNPDIKGTKINIGPIIDQGLELCD